MWEGCENTEHLLQLKKSNISLTGRGNTEATWSRSLQGWRFKKGKTFFQLFCNTKLIVHTIRPSYHLIHVLLGVFISYPSNKCGVICPDQQFQKVNLEKMAKSLWSLFWRAESECCIRAISRSNFKSKRKLSDFKAPRGNGSRPEGYTAIQFDPFSRLHPSPKADFSDSVIIIIFLPSSQMCCFSVRDAIWEST